MNRELLKEIAEVFRERRGGIAWVAEPLLEKIETELAKPDPEPVAYRELIDDNIVFGKVYHFAYYKENDNYTPLYAEPVDQSARIELLEQRLKAVHAEIEPVAWMIIDKDFNCMGFLPFKEKDTIPVYTTPPDQSARIAALKHELEQANEDYISLEEAYLQCQKDLYDETEKLAALQANREPEPIAYITGFYGGYPTINVIDGTVLPNGTPLYAAPITKPLTNDEICEIWEFESNKDPIKFARALEAAHGITS